MWSFNMDLQKLIKEIDESYYKKNNYYLSINEPEEFAKQVALRFGKQCFDAAKEEVENYSDRYYTFESYLKSIEYGVL